MLEFLCPTCGKRVQGDNSFAGKTVVCPGCNATMTAPITAIAASAHLPSLPTAPSDTAISEGLPPQEPPAPSLRKAAPHFIRSAAPYLVVLVVVGTVVALLVPAVQKVRESAARTQSTNNLKQITLEFVSFHDVCKRLPFNGTGPARASDPTSGSWAFQLTQFEQSDFFSKPNVHSGFQKYLCPGRGRPSVCTTGAWSDYCINPWLNDPHGRVDVPDVKRTMVGITDGVSNTIFVGQGSVDPDLYGATVAIPQSNDILKGGDAATARRSTTIHQDKAGGGELTWGGPFPQGLLVGMGDGTVRMFPYSMPAGTITNGVSTAPGPFGDGCPMPDGVVWPFGVFLTPTGGETITVPD